MLLIKGFFFSFCSIVTFVMTEPTGQGFMLRSPELWPRLISNHERDQVRECETWVLRGRGCVSPVTSLRGVPRARGSKPGPGRHSPP